MSLAHEKFVKSQHKRNAAPLDLDLDSTALVIIDMQEYFLNPQSPFSRYLERRESGLFDYYLERTSSMVEPNLKRLLDRFRQAGGRVVFTTVASEFADGRDLSPIFQQMNAEASEQVGDVVFPPRADPWARIVASLEPLPDEAVINKTTYGSFTSSGLDAAFRNLGIKTLVIGGVVANRCVETTARDATDRGYRVITVDDGTATFSDEAHEYTMLSLMGSYGFVRTTDDLLALLDV